MKKYLILGLVLSSVASAQVNQADIKNFNFNYTAPLGEGTAESFSYSAKAAQKVTVEKIAQDFLIKLEGVENREFTFKNLPSMVVDASSIELNGFNLGLNERATITMVSGSFVSPDKEVDFKNFNLACDRDVSFPEIQNQMIAGCLQKMTLKAGSLSSAGEGLDQALAGAVDEGHALGSAIGIKNANVKVNAGKFEVSAEVKAQISGKVTASGSAKFEASQKKLTIKISEVKFGILDITSKVFDELKKQESSSLKVSKPYVYVTLK